MKVYVIDKKSIMKITLVFALIFTSVLVSRPYVGEVVSTLAQSKDRKLPIYCVETDKKQVAVSFDAAWGAGILGHYWRG